MKKAVQFIQVVFVTLSFLAFRQIAYAQNDICPVGEFQNLCKLKLDNGSAAIIGKIVTILLILAVILALFFLIWGGIRWILSGGDKAKIEQARSTIIAALVGLVIAFLAFFILNTVTFFVTGKTFTTINIPTLAP